MFRKPIIRSTLLAAACSAVIVAGCSVHGGGDADGTPSSSPVAESATATRAAPLRIVTPTAVTPGSTVPADATTTPGGSGENPETYLVAEGDTLYAIALRFDVDLNALIELNGLSDPNDIQPGQELRIPGRE